MYHLQCLITLIVSRKRCQQCRAPFHRHLYAQFNFQIVMVEHWEYNQYNTLNQPQTWGANMQWIWQVGMSFITFGSQ